MKKSVAVYRSPDGGRILGFSLLDVADDEASREKGMGGRRSVGEFGGMEFRGLRKNGYFWMKGCLIPLDIMFCKDGKVTLAYSMEADGGDADYPYTEEDKAIEVPFGYCGRHGIFPGCLVSTEDVSEETNV